MDNGNFQKPLQFDELKEVAKNQALTEVLESEKKNLLFGDFPEGVLQVISAFVEKMESWGLELDEKRGDFLHLNEKEPWKITFTTVGKAENVIKRMGDKEGLAALRDLRNMKRVEVEFFLNEVMDDDFLTAKIQSGNIFQSVIYYDKEEVKKEIKFIIDFDTEHEVKDKYVFIDLFMEDGYKEVNSELPKSLEVDVKKVAENAIKRLLGYINKRINSGYKEFEKRVKFEMSPETQINRYRKEMENNSSTLYRRYFFDESGAIASENLELRAAYKEKYETWLYYETMKRENPFLYHQLFPKS